MPSFFKLIIEYRNIVWSVCATEKIEKVELFEATFDSLAVKVFNKIYTRLYGSTEISESSYCPFNLTAYKFHLPFPLEAYFCCNSLTQFIKIIINKLFTRIGLICVWFYKFGYNHR